MSLKEAREQQARERGENVQLKENAAEAQFNERDEGPEKEN